MTTFCPNRFLADIRKIINTLGIAYSDETTRNIVKLYAINFEEGPVLWRYTDRKGDPLNYRFYERRPVDLATVAEKAGLLPRDNSLTKLVKSWCSLYDGPGTPEQSCDFDSAAGLVKIWVYLKGIRPLDDILNAYGVPEQLKIHQATFYSLGLDSVRHVAVDYEKNTVNLYFRARGPVSAEQAASFIALAGGFPPSEKQFAELEKDLNPKGFTFSVTIVPASGAISRVAFYALRLPIGTFPEINSQLKSFFATAPSCDTEEMNAIAWSFGKGNMNYVKGERSYSGRLVSLMRYWNSTFSSDS
ncbi:hypothetical protein N431DRAFT_527667 [Stipitochalara longipes BDJ]|nr:hypothetical protein N431DRAFT_527667 [Stipitochalara longipes BDJ]